MKYGDELDRVPSAGLSRRQFLTASGNHAARLAAGLFLPGGAGRPPESDDLGEEEPDRREG